MGYANHVGRVGALAVALGIGAAVVSTAGMAWVQDEGGDPGSQSQNSTPGQTSGDPAPETPGDPAPEAPGETPGDPVPEAPGETPGGGGGDLGPVDPPS